jgi:hypothetical protein
MLLNNSEVVTRITTPQAQVRPIHLQTDKGAVSSGSTDVGFTTDGVKAMWRELYHVYD